MQKVTVLGSRDPAQPGIGDEHERKKDPMRTLKRLLTVIVVLTAFAGVGAGTSWASGVAPAATITKLTWSKPVVVKNSPPSVKPAPALGTVSCPTTSFCLAFNYYAPLAYIYRGKANGTAGKWSEDTSLKYPPPTNTGPPSVTSLSCASRSFCVAVALTFSGTSVVQSIIYRDGKWSIDNAFKTPRISYGSPSVSCPTVSFCAVVEGQLAAIYRDGKWTKSTKIEIRQPKAAMVVSCATASHCVAVDNNGRVFTYNADKWSWTGRVGYFDSPSGYSYTPGLSCPTTSFCLVSRTVDNTTGGLVSSKVFALSQGTWKLSKNLLSPLAIGSISCHKTTFCVSLGGSGSSPGVFIYSNGKWSRQVVAEWTSWPPSAISCPSTSWCTSVALNADVYIGRRS